MKAKEGVIDFLNKVLTNDLTAINQYFLHAEMCRHWGYERLYEKLRAMSIEEMKDVEKVMEKILYLESVPNLQRLGRVEVGESAEEHLRLDLEQEQGSGGTLREAVAHCAQVGDFGTRALLEGFLVNQAKDIDWLETQLETIKQVGIQNYLSQQMKK